MNKDPYPKAIVPEFLVKRTIETMPLETAYYLDPGDEDDYYNEPGFCVLPDGSLHARLSTQLDEDDAEPSSILGRIGVMRVGFVHNGSVSEGLIADLRFLQDGQLIQADDTPPDDQEEFNSWVEAKRELRPIVAFIAPSDADDDEGIFYGADTFHDALGMLRDRADTMIEAANQRASQLTPGDKQAEEKASKTQKKVKTDD